MIRGLAVTVGALAGWHGYRATRRGIDRIVEEFLADMTDPWGWR